MRHVPFATYIGGPLDGKTIRQRIGRWALYRDDAGKSILAAVGDTWWMWPEGKRPSGYALQRIDETLYYIHTTRIENYRSFIQ